MKNFLRALRFAWPYRGRLMLSIVCAGVVALLWGANFTAIYPILTVLGHEKLNLQTWLDNQIKEKQAHIDKYDVVLRDRRNKLMALETVKKHESDQALREGREPDTSAYDLQISEWTRLIAKDEWNSGYARSQIYWYQLLQIYVVQYCPEGRFETLALLLVIVIVAVAAKGVFDFFQESLVGSVVNLSLFDLRNRFYRNAIHYDLNQFTDDGTHELMARFTNDMDSLSTGTKTLFGKVVAEPLKALSCVIFACFISWRLTLLFLIIVPVALLLMSKVGSYMKRASRRVLESMSSLYKILQETFLGIRIVKAFTMERYERRRFFIGTKDYYRKGMYVVNLDAISGPILELLGVMAIALALIVGAYLVIEGETHIWGFRMTGDQLDAASLLQLYALLAAIADPVRKLSNVYNRIQSGAAAADRIFAYMDRKPKVRSNANAIRLPRHRQSIEFKDVCFSYVPGQPVLSNVRLHVPFGETVALVGRNGSGKSTLVGLLSRFYDPDHGAVLVDGMDVRRVNLRSLRQNLGLVTQETILFDDTIQNNIAYGHRHAKPEEIEEAAKKAFAHDFIVKLRNGYETRVGEMGTGLSGGQRQRLALARAILRDPAILVLDEATSAADMESENLIQRALAEFVKNRTTFIITHRLSTLEIASRIVVLEGGQIEAIGTHRELMKSCGTYQRLQEVYAQRQAA